MRELYLLSFFEDVDVIVLGGWVVGVEIVDEVFKIVIYFEEWWYWGFIRGFEMDGEVKFNFVFGMIRVVCIFVGFIWKLVVLD